MEWIIPAVSAIACCASLGMAWGTRVMLKRMEAMREEMAGIRKFYYWGKDTRIVVRNKLDHVNVTDKALLDLYKDFEMGRAFRNAAMMYQNQEFKVYVQAKGE